MRDAPIRTSRSFSSALPFILREHQGPSVLTDLSQVHLSEQISPSVLTDIALST